MMGGLLGLVGLGRVIGSQNMALRPLSRGGLNGSDSFSLVARIEDCETPVEGAFAISKAALGVAAWRTGRLITGLEELVDVPTLELGRGGLDLPEGEETASEVFTLGLEVSAVVSRGLLGIVSEGSFSLGGVDFSRGLLWFSGLRFSVGMGFSDFVSFSESITDQIVCLAPVDLGEEAGLEVVIESLESSREGFEAGI